MNKKDRIAVVLSLIVLFTGGSQFTGSPSDEEVIFGFITLLLAFIYWSYRFIKGDISFLGSKFKED